jgi:hypothetical protein
MKEPGQKSQTSPMKSARSSMKDRCLKAVVAGDRKDDVGEGESNGDT